MLFIGEAVVDKMLSFVTCHLDTSIMHGQAYDGASKMSGKTNGAAAHISSQYPYVFYTPCASNCLYRAVVASFKEANVCNMISFVKWLSVFSLLTRSS